VDLVVESTPFSLTPIEIKLSKTPHAGMAKGIERLCASAGRGVSVEPGYVVCLAERSFPLTRGVRAVPWRELPDIL
jgi:hypothetical protein